VLPKPLLRFAHSTSPVVAVRSANVVLLCLIWRVVCQPGRVSFSPIALVLVGVEVGWVGGGPGAVRDVGQPDMRGSGWPQDHGSSWGAAVYGIERDPQKGCS
jgi:hypothetical protein